MAVGTRQGKGRPKRIEQVLKALETGFAKAGRPIDHAVLDFARTVAKDPRFQLVCTTQPKQLAIASVIIGILLTVEANKDMSEEQWEQFLEIIKTELPYSLRSKLPPMMKGVFKELPKRHSTGRNEILSPEQHKRACDLVSKYHRAGDSKRMAYEKVAAQMNCSARTVQRAWQQRLNKRSTEPSQ